LQRHVPFQQAVGEAHHQNAVLADQADLGLPQTPVETAIAASEWYRENGYA
jgi:hypothetical protein